MRGKSIFRAFYLLAGTIILLACAADYLVLRNELSVLRRQTDFLTSMFEHDRSASSTVVTEEDPIAIDAHLRNLAVMTNKATVTIYAHSKTADKKDKRSIGSGVIIEPNGYILTCYHVIENAHYLSVRKLEDNAAEVQETYSEEAIGSETEYMPIVVGYDKLRDLALLKIESNNFPIIKLGENPMAGQRILAIGTPYDYKNSLSIGVISKSISVAAPRLGNQSVVNHFIQMNLALYPGNSGGPIVDMRGELVGIAESIMDGSSKFAFAIPVSDLRVLIPRLLEGGEMKRGSLGVDAFWDGSIRGLSIIKVEPVGPAEKAGLKTGDVIWAIDGRHISNRIQYLRAVDYKKPGTVVTLDIIRDGKNIRIECVLG